MTTGTHLRKKIIHEKLHFAQIYFGLQISLFAQKNLAMNIFYSNFNGKDSRSNERIYQLYKFLKFTEKYATVWT